MHIQHNQKDLLDYEQNVIQVELIHLDQDQLFLYIYVLTNPKNVMNDHIYLPQHPLDQNLNKKEIFINKKKKIFLPF